MKLLRFGTMGAERPGLLTAQGVRDISSLVPDLGGARLDPDVLATIAARDPASFPLVAAPGRIGSCVAPTGKIVCVGLNYTDHAAETGMTPPDEPILFMKGCRLTGPDDPIAWPKGAEAVDWEIELAIVIGRDASCVSEAEAPSHIAGYATFTDMSERDWQTRRGGQWVKGKSWPGFAPIGPWLVTSDEVGDPQGLRLWLDVDGERMQDGGTANMVFGAHFLVSYISQFMPLYAGDVIATGTPAGVGMGKKPPRYLKPGSVIRAGIDGLGEQTIRCG